MNLHDLQAETLPHSIEAEHSVIGALLLDNESIYRIPEVKAEHFYDYDNGRIFAEIARQIAAGMRCDVLTLFEVLKDQVQDCLPYLNKLANNTPSAANVGRYAAILVDKAIKRSLIQLAGEMQGTARGNEEAGALIDQAASKLEKLAQKRVKQEPQRLSDMLGNYVELIQARMDGAIKPIQTGFPDLDARLDGGLERGTLTVIAGRPSMGKTAMGLCLARNVAEWGSALFLSMEMPAHMVNDRNIAALGKLPLRWLKKPNDKTPEDKEMFDRMTHAFQRANDLNLYIDDQTALNMLDIRGKARSVKRKQGLDLLVIDQLSFITGSQERNKWDAVGEYTRGLLQLAKELDMAVALLCQLNRGVEDRAEKRPMMSDLAMSGSIEQDASNILFLYRDEVYNPDTMDKGICEVITTKQRQGEPGIVGLSYNGAQTRFESLAYEWKRSEQRTSRKRGFD